MIDCLHKDDNGIVFHLYRYLSVSRTSECFRCLNNTSHKVISMSLYGESSRYTMGAIRNAQLLPITFPGWRLWFYVELPLPGRKHSYGKVPTPIIAKLVELGAEIRYIDVSVKGLAPMLWRFTVMEDPDVDVFIVRDCDSRLTLRDAIVVSDWLRTGKIFHCVRDHPSHSRYSISGGLWGARRKPFLTLFGEGRLSSVMSRYGASYVQDMHFLGSEVWPKVTQVAYCHDSYSCQRYASSHPFPVARVGAEHLGQVYDEFSIGRKSDMDTIRRTPVNTKCVVSQKNSSVVK